MRIIKYRATVPNATFAETEPLNLKVQEHQKITVCALTASTNVKMVVRYVFEDDDGTEVVGDIQTINLTQNVLTIINFNMKLGYLRIVTDDVTGTPSGGAIRIDATTAK
tara:strand:+ start:1279 stop:1605 length:327 start_codon:yes stop_codon:yes gene_type:complete